MAIPFCWELDCQKCNTHATVLPVLHQSKLYFQERTPQTWSIMIHAWASWWLVMEDYVHSHCKEQSPKDVLTNFELILNRKTWPCIAKLFQKWLTNLNLDSQASQLCMNVKRNSKFSWRIVNTVTHSWICLHNTV